MEKKNIVIGILILLLTISLYLVFQKKKEAQTETAVIPPSESLRISYATSSQHSSIANIAELSCFPTSRFDCGGGTCTISAPATYYFVDYGTDNGTYFRCDTKGCDSYPVRVNPSGEFTQFIPSQGQAMMFKVATGDTLDDKGQFIDIATLGTGAVISSGTCEFKK